jgi:hypothetical protein
VGLLIFVWCLVQEKLNELAYDAQVAKLHYELQNTVCCLDVLILDGVRVVLG